MVCIGKPFRRFFKKMHIHTHTEVLRESAHMWECLSAFDSTPLCVTEQNRPDLRFTHPTGNDLAI